MDVEIGEAVRQNRFLAAMLDYSGPGSRSSDQVRHGINVLMARATPNLGEEERKGLLEKAA